MEVSRAGLVVGIRECDESMAGEERGLQAGGWMGWIGGRIEARRLRQLRGDALAVGIGDRPMGGERCDMGRSKRAWRDGVGGEGRWGLGPLLEGREVVWVMMVLRTKVHTEGEGMVSL